MPDIVIGNGPQGQLKFPLSKLKEIHFAIRGRVGQMKTLLLVSILRQFLRLPDHAVISIDLGGDQAATWILYEAALQAGKPFYFFSLSPRHPSCSWDPIMNTPVFLEDPQLAAAGLAKGLNLLYGEGYGRSYWSRLNQAAIHQAFDGLRLAGIPLPSFPEVADELRRMSQGKRSSQNVSEAYLAAEQLLRYPALTSRRSQQITISQAIEEGACIVFYLPTAMHGEAATAVASLAAWCVFVEAASRFDSGLATRVIHLSIDEFSQIASGRSSLSALLAMARKWALQVYLTYQNDEQLVTADGDLTPIVRGLCQRIIFTCDTEEENRELRYQSLDVLRPELSQSSHGLSTTTSVRETLEPGLTRNEIIELSAQKQKAYAVFKLGDEHRDPIPLTVIPPTTKDKHEELKRKPFTDLPFPLGSPLPVAPSKSPQRSSRVRPTSAATSTNEAHRQKYTQILDDLKAEESWSLKS